MWKSGVRMQANCSKRIIGGLRVLCFHVYCTFRFPFFGFCACLCVVQEPTTCLFLFFNGSLLKIDAFSFCTVCKLINFVLFWILW